MQAATGKKGRVGARRVLLGDRGGDGGEGQEWDAVEDAEEMKVEGSMIVEAAGAPMEVKEWMSSTGRGAICLSQLVD